MITESWSRLFYSTRHCFTVFRQLYFHHPSVSNFSPFDTLPFILEPKALKPFCILPSHPSPLCSICQQFFFLPALNSYPTHHTFFSNLTPISHPVRYLYFSLPVCNLLPLPLYPVSPVFSFLFAYFLFLSFLFPNEDAFSCYNILFNAPI